MKVSIRFSILAITISLLLGVYVAITLPAHNALMTLLFTTTERSLYQASDQVSNQVISYLTPLERSTYIGAKLIADHTVYPTYNKGFLSLLHNLNTADANITSVYWGDEAGNFYLEKEINPETFLSQTIINTPEGRKQIDNLYNYKWQLLKSQESIQTSFKPQFRPWYQDAKLSKTHYWSIYPGAKIGTTMPELNVTSSVPVYDENKKLLGVFAIDISLKAISDFLSTIKITPNNIVFICNEDQEVLAAHSYNTNLIIGDKLPTLADLHMPIAEASFKEHKKQQKDLFYFDLDKKTYTSHAGGYASIYKKIPYIIDGKSWQVAIIIPGKDIVTAELQHSVDIDDYIIWGSMILAIIIAAFFSSRLSKPIMQLSNNSELICQLELKKTQKIFSNIKEISLMANAFNKMKNTLQSFERYLPITLVKNLITTGKIAEVGGETRKLSIFFSDIENFTALSENMSPKFVMEYLSEYFQVATKIILHTGGTVDKYIGDGIMAFWGAPIEDKDHALHACQAAIQMQKAFQELNKKWSTENKPILATRMGISTGDVVVGNVGSDDRLSYTSLGDTVNISSRLEELNKTYKTYVMIDEETYDLVKDVLFTRDFDNIDIQNIESATEDNNLSANALNDQPKDKKYKLDFRFLDKVILKGKTKARAIYEIRGIKNITEQDTRTEYDQKFQVAFEKYANGDWIVALNLFTSLAQQYSDDYLSKVFIERCNLLLKNPPKKWTGCWKMHSK